MVSTPSDAFDRAVEFAGSVSALARGIGISPWGLSKLNKEKIPTERCLAIESFTKGVVRAEDLRPDVNWVYVKYQQNFRIG